MYYVGVNVSCYLNDAYSQHAELNINEGHTGVHASLTITLAMKTEYYKL